MQTMTDRIDDRIDNRSGAQSTTACVPRVARERTASGAPLAGARARVSSWLRFVEHGWPHGVPPCSGWGA